jgi:drug/metabolite transporter (DMT)-like permease
MSLKYLSFSLLAVFIWSGNTIVNKLAAGAIPPGVIAFERWLLAFFILTPFVARSVWLHRNVVRSHAIKLGALGLLGMAICQGVGYYAASFTTATNMAILLSLVPLLTLMLNAIFLRDMPSGQAAIGVVISLLGILIVLGKGNPAVLASQGVGRGDALMLLVSLALAGYGILLKRWAAPMPAFTSLYIQIGWAVIFLLPGFLTERPAALTLENGIMILYAAIPGSIVAPYLWMLTVNHLGAARVSVFMNLIPIVTALAASLLLHESLHSYHLLGGALTILGIVMSQKKSARKVLKQQVIPIER